MYGHFIVFGDIARHTTEENLRAWWRLPAEIDAFIPNPRLTIGTFAPRYSSVARMIAWSGNRRVFVSIDGYLLCDGLPAVSDQRRHLTRLADLIDEKGITAALATISCGCYTIVAFHFDAGTAHIANDHLASIPLYFSELKGGCIVSSNPVAIARSKLADNAIDWTACAEWTFLGHTIGSRYMTRGIRVLDPHVSLVCDCGQGTSHWLDRGTTPVFDDTSGKAPTTDELNAELRRCLADLSDIEPQMAGLLSAGKDSRLILAAWPLDKDLPSYTYGDPGSLEIPIAQEVAKVRRSTWHHVWPHGDDVAGQIESMFDANGLVVFPDRYLTARQAAEDGITGVTDGLGGDVYLGNGYYGNAAHYAGLIPRICRYLALYLDQRVSVIGTEKVARTFLRDLEEKNATHPLSDYVRRDVIGFLEEQRENMYADILSETIKYMPRNDSLAELRRNLMMANRSAHAIIQQGIMCRCFVRVYYPFVSDLAFLRLQMRIKPYQAAYNRPILRLFGRCYPDFGRIKYGASLIPLSAAPIRHQVSKQLIGRGLYLPWLSGNPHGRQRDANSWASWLRQSEHLRQTAVEFMRQGGIVDEVRAAKTLNAIRHNRIQASGKMFHMAAIARWIAMSSVGPRWGAEA